MFAETHPNGYHVSSIKPAHLASIEMQVTLIWAARLQSDINAVKYGEKREQLGITFLGNAE